MRVSESESRFLTTICIFKICYGLRLKKFPGTPRRDPTGPGANTAYPGSTASSHNGSLINFCKKIETSSLSLNLHFFLMAPADKCEVRCMYMVPFALTHYLMRFIPAVPNFVCLRAFVHDIFRTEVQLCHETPYSLQFRVGR